MHVILGYKMLVSHNSLLLSLQSFILLANLPRQVITPVITQLTGVLQCHASGFLRGPRCSPKKKVLEFSCLILSESFTNPFYVPLNTYIYTFSEDYVTTKTIFEESYGWKSRFTMKNWKHATIISTQ